MRRTPDAATRRCELHPAGLKGSTRQHRRERGIALAGAVRCWRCGQPFSYTNPPTADHVIPRTQGGADHHSNYLPAHASCNSRAGAALTNG